MRHTLHTKNPLTSAHTVYISLYTACAICQEDLHIILYFYRQKYLHSIYCTQKRTSASVSAHVLLHTIALPRPADLPTQTESVSSSYHKGGIFSTSPSSFSYSVKTESKVSPSHQTDLTNIKLLVFVCLSETNLRQYLLFASNSN